MEYNIHQLEAINTDANKLLCLAGAGTGKTASMIARLCRLVKDGVDPNSILVLTFTNAAAFEMKERYQKQNVVGRCPEFRTFHSFCYHLISVDRNVLTAIGYSSVPAIAQESEAKRIETEAIMRVGLKLSKQKKEGSVPLTMKEEYDLKLFRKTQQKMMQSKELITFDYLCSSVCDLFIRNDESVSRYKNQFKYVFVDEFQDTDKLQWSFVSSFTDSKLFVVGDALQAIYGFRGADSSIIKSIAENPVWSVVKLSDNYRSTSNICNYANTNSIYASDRYRIEIHSDKEGELVHQYPYHSRFNQIDSNAMNKVIDELGHLKENQTCAILFRTNREVEQAMDLLRENSIAYTACKSNYDCIHYLNSVTSNQYALDWLSTFLNADAYANWIRVSTGIELECEDSSQLTTVLFTKFCELYKNNMKILERLSTLSEIRTIMRDRSKQIFQKCKDIFDLLGLESIPFESNATSIRELCDYLLQCIESIKSSELYVGTIHSVKGLEFDSVYLLGVDGNTFHLTDEENCNLFYVGITRAKSSLSVFKERCPK